MRRGGADPASVPGVLGDHQERIKALEDAPPSAAVPYGLEDCYITVVRSRASGDTADVSGTDFSLSTLPGTGGFSDAFTSTGLWTPTTERLELMVAGRYLFFAIAQTANLDDDTGNLQFSAQHSDDNVTWTDYGGPGSGEVSIGEISPIMGFHTAFLANDLLKAEVAPPPATFEPWRSITGYADVSGHLNYALRFQVGGIPSPLDSDLSFGLYVLRVQKY